MTLRSLLERAGILQSDAVRPGSQVGLSAFGSDPDGDLVSYAWDADGDGDFDDGTGQSLQFVYSSAGTRSWRIRPFAMKAEAPRLSPSST